MSPGLLTTALVALGALGAEEPAPPWEVCLVERAPVEGAGAAEVADALTVEAHKRGRSARVVLAPDPVACRAGDVVVVVGEVALVAVAGQTREVAVATLRPVDRAAELARLVATLAAAEVRDHAALVGELPSPPVLVVAPPVRVVWPPVEERAPAGATRASVGLALAADPGESSVFGRLEVQLTAPVLVDGLELGARVAVATPAVASRGAVEARRVELGAHGVAVGRGRLGAAWAVAGEVDLGLAYRWTSGRASEAGLTPAASVEHGEPVASVGAGAWVAWEPADGPLWLALGVCGRRYLGGTDLVAPAGRMDAPRWSLDGGLRIGVRL